NAGDLAKIGDNLKGQFATASITGLRTGAIRDPGEVKAVADWIIANAPDKANSAAMAIINSVRLGALDPSQAQVTDPMDNLMKSVNGQPNGPAIVKSLEKNFKSAVVKSAGLGVITEDKAKDILGAGTPEFRDAQKAIKTVEAARQKRVDDLRRDAQALTKPM